MQREHELLEDGSIVNFAHENGTTRDSLQLENGSILAVGSSQAQVVRPASTSMGGPLHQKNNQYFQQFQKRKYQKFVRQLKNRLVSRNDKYVTTNLWHQQQ